MARPERRIPVVRLGAELLTIVLGILVAFGIDAWWDGRSDDIAEQALLTSLRAELEENRTVIETSIEAHAGHAAIAEFLLRAGPTTSTDSLAGAVAASTFFRTTDLHVGTVNSAIEGGALERIGDAALRDVVASWPGDFNDIVENENLEWSLVHERQFSLIGEKLDLAALAGSTGAWPSPLDDPRIPSANRIGDLLDDDRFRTLLFQRLINDRLIVGELETLRDHVVRGIELLDAGIRG